MSLVSVEHLTKLYKEELASYSQPRRVANGTILHISPIGTTGMYVGTLTSFNENGYKSDTALPFAKFIHIVNELEALLAPYADGVAGRLVGWNPSPGVKEFLLDKKVHRYFFLREKDVLTFLNAYTNRTRVQNRESFGVDMYVLFG